MQGAEGVAYTEKESKLALEAMLCHTWWERDTRGSWNKDRTVNKMISFKNDTY